MNKIIQICSTPDPNIIYGLTEDGELFELEFDGMGSEWEFITGSPSETHEKV